MKSNSSVTNDDKKLGNWFAGVPYSGEWLFLAVCLVSAFLIRFLALPQNSIINGDGIFYATLGSRFISGDFERGLSAYWSPLYSSLVGIFHLFFQDLELSGRAVSLVTGSLLIIPSYVLIRTFFGRVAANIGTVLVVVHPSLIVSSTWVMTESTYTLLFTSGVVGGWLALESGKKLAYLFTGLLFGAAFLTKPESIGFAGLFLLLAFVIKLAWSRSEIKKLPAAFLVFAAGFSIFSLPYIVFIHQKTGRWTISQKLVSNSTFEGSERGLLKVTDDRWTTMQDRIWWDDYDAEKREPKAETQSSSGSFAAQNRQGDVPTFLSRSASNLIRQVRHYVPEMFPVLFILIGAVGFLAKPWNIDRVAKEIYLLFFVTCMFLGYAVTVIELRYLYPLIPICLGWVGLGCAAVGRYLSHLGRRWRLKPVFVYVFLLLALAFSLIPLFFHNLKDPQMDLLPFEEKNAGLWLKHNSEPSSVVMSRNATVAFYAGAAHIFLPDEELPTILEYARKKRVNYIVLSERRLRQRSDLFRSMEGAVEDLTPVYEDDSFKDFKVKIFAINQ
ncbi:MAG: glycosyltransferase family 39 protein [Pyrinomonadaceae bacterium]